MGISTFIHLVSAAAADVLAVCPDNTINRFISTMCKRPWVQTEEEAAESPQEELEVVDDIEALRQIVDVASTGGSQSANYGDEVYMEVGTKFWKAKIVGNYFVSVSYGKKGTKGQSNSHSGDDARAYYDKKVKEKLKKKYKFKDPDAAANKAARAALPDAEPKSKRSKNILYRADLDKADEHELFFSILPNTPIGEDVSYGSAYYASPEDVASLNRALEPFSEEDAAALFDGDMPDTLGGVCGITKDKDMEYALIHFVHFKAMCKQAADNGLGFFFHFY